MSLSPKPLSDGGQSKRARGGARLRRLRWPILATGVLCGTFLVAFAQGLIPGIENMRGAWGRIGILAGAAYLYAAGIGSWIMFTRLGRKLDTRD
jgi:hypothetical protein